ncbi:hypothetical protein P4V33_09415 [Brevibacillus borstelensis]|uniref:hypothetical protein n=1 Tax=Brevibacillus borstelensis TaxID=45462 RepID=UPI002E1A941B|nr:hypothetical protein [Brevibacillus borstelensis]
MKKSFITVVGLCISLALLQACDEKETAKIENEVKPQEATTQPKETAPTTETSSSQVSSQPQNHVEAKPEESKPTTAPEEPKIDTSVFAYADSVDVTDARDITQHIDLAVHMGEGPTPAMATQHVITQAYDFLQQKDIKGANTVTIGIMQQDIRIFQITVDLKKFKPGENFIKSVLSASKIEKMSDSVKEYGRATGFW